MSYIIALIAIVVLGVGFTLFQSRQPEEGFSTTVTEQTTNVKLPAGDVSESITSSYNDGTYQTQVTYQTPKRDNYAIDVSVTLSKNLLSDVKIVYTNGAENNPNAQRFEAAYRNHVIGKNIDAINLSRVGGASLTTEAFNQALTRIKADAKS